MYNFSTKESGYICIAPKIFYFENICYVINENYTCQLFKKNENVEIN